MIKRKEGGSTGLGKLDYLFNKTTQAFLLKSDLKPGLRVLDIGCGSGVMSQWIAKQVGGTGHVVGIENDINQLNAAKQLAIDLKVNNVSFELGSAYELGKLNQKFDLVFCRFVLHHLHDPTKAIAQIYGVLNKQGVYVAEEGIVNFAFSYPNSFAWGNECTRLPPPWTDVAPDNRDPNIGIKMVTKMKQAGFNIQEYQIIHPVMVTKEEKQYLMLGIDEFKEFYLSEGHTPDEWEAFVKATNDIVNNDNQIAGFYGSFQVSGRKQEN